MASAAILFFEKFEILTICPPKGANLRHRSKFREDRSNRWGDITMFVIFNMAAAAILVFKKFEILTVCPP